MRTRARNPSGSRESCMTAMRPPGSCICPAARMTSSWEAIRYLHGVRREMRHGRRIVSMGMTMTVTVQETEHPAGATLLVSHDVAARLGIAAGQTVTVNVTPSVPDDSVVVNEDD